MSSNQLPVDIPQLQDAIDSSIQAPLNPLIIDTSLVPDPQVQAMIDQVIESRIMHATNAQSRSWHNHEQALLAQQAAMQRQLDVLTTQLAHSSLTRTFVHDAEMQVGPAQEVPQIMLANGQGGTSRPRRTARATSRTWSATSSVNSNTSGVTTRGMLARQAAAAQTASDSQLRMPPLESGTSVQQGGDEPSNQSNPSNFTDARKTTAGNLHRFRLRDMPTDMGGLNKAMALHIRILWGLLDARAVLGDPPASMLAGFRDHFTNQSQLLAVSTGRDLISRQHVRVGTARTVSGTTSRIYIQAAAVEEHMLNYIQGCLSKFSLPIWCPDLRQSPYSLYNSACRIIALDTFKQSLISHAYSYLSPNTTYASQSELLMKLFDHFVFFYMKKRYLQEGRRPGSVGKDLLNNPQYVARTRLAEARSKFLSENGYPEWYSKLISPKATSDDEYDLVREVYIVRRRRERSAKAEMFFSMLDAKREESAKQKSSRAWQGRKRLRLPSAEPQIYSEFEELPKGLPIDYFDPTFYNNLQPKIRLDAAVAKISMLPDIERSFTWCSEERLWDDTFNRRYAPAVLQQYNIVTLADMTNRGNDSDDDDEEWAGEEETIGEGSSMSEDEQEDLEDDGPESEEGEEEERHGPEEASEEDTAVEDEDL